jgi:hypothetical protein
MDVLVHHLFELLFALDPIIFNRVRQPTENVVAILQGVSRPMDPVILTD